jgi:UDP-xylose/UDP-N-acetylglucosamine transporter B4
MDYSFALSFIFGGCCSNVWTYEQLLRQNPEIGSALTFSQMLFITIQSLPLFLCWKKNRWGLLIPALKTRQVPLRQWGLQVVVLTSGSLLNNWVYAFHVPLSVQIIIRSAGVVVAMLLGRLFLNRSYTARQLIAVTLVSVGVCISSISTNSSVLALEGLSATYIYGIIMLVASLFLTAILGILQERTYKTYGPCWREGVFYTHVLSLPIFLFLRKDIVRGFQGLPSVQASSSNWVPYLVLFLNLVTQVMCVSGVNGLTSLTSSVSTGVVLTARKALSLCISIWYFGSDWNYFIVVGAGMVFLGSLLYSTSRPPVINKKE